jgi:hypothetical protein
MIPVHYIKCNSQQMVKQVKKSEISVGKVAFNEATAIAA